MFALPFSHSKNDGECGGNFIANGWMFNTLACSAILNSSSTSFFLNNYASSSCLCLCSLFCVSFSFATFCKFSIVFSALMFLWTLELWKHTQLLIVNKNNFQLLFCLFLSSSFLPIPFIFWLAHRLSINASSSKLLQPITITFYVPCTATWKHVTSSLRMNALDFICQLFSIHSPPKLVVLTPHHSPRIPSTNYANTYVNYINTFINCINKFVNYAHTYDDYANTSTDLVDNLNTPISKLCVPDSSLL